MGWFVDRFFHVINILVEFKFEGKKFTTGFLESFEDSVESVCIFFYN
jgi:hypothetical protein